MVSILHRLVPIEYINLICHNDVYPKFIHFLNTGSEPLISSTFDQNMLDLVKRNGFTLNLTKVIQDPMSIPKNLEKNIQKTKTSLVDYITQNITKVNCQSCDILVKSELFDVSHHHHECVVYIKDRILHNIDVEVTKAYINFEDSKYIRVTNNIILETNLNIYDFNFDCKDI
jgi:hypothetical protein